MRPRIKGCCALLALLSIGFVGCANVDLLSLAGSKNKNSGTGTSVVASVNNGFSQTIPVTNASCSLFSVAVSANGKVIAAVDGGPSCYLYYSTDGGSGWNANTSYTSASGAWHAVAVSRNGQYIAANKWGSLVAVFDGTAWSDYSLPSVLAPSPYLNAVFFAGSTLVVGDNNSGSLYKTPASALSWSTAYNSTSQWGVVGASDDGQYISALEGSTGIYVSTNSGSTWSHNETTPGSWYGISCSATGQYQAAVNNGNNIYISHDYGATWSVSPGSTPSLV